MVALESLHARARAREAHDSLLRMVDRAGVLAEALDVRPASRRAGADAAKRRGVDVDNVHVLAEGVDAQRAREPRRARGREHVVHAGEVVAERGGRIVADEDRPCVADLVDERLGVRRTRARGARVRGRRPRCAPRRRRRRARCCRWWRGSRRCSARRARRRAARRPPRSTASATASSHVTRTAAPPGPCSAWARRSAATQRGSAVSSATIATSDGPAKPSIPTTPATSRFADRDVDVAGTDDDVDGADRLGAVRHRRDRLRAADAVHLVDTGERGRGERDRGDRAVGTRAARRARPRRRRRCGPGPRS